MNLPVVAILTPLILLLFCLSGAIRTRMASLLWLAPLPALLASFLSVGRDPLVLSPDPYLLTISLDKPGAMLLGVASLLWIVAGFCAPSFLKGSLNKGRFVVCWLLVLTGSLGIFMAADLAGFFLFFAMVSLPAYGLVIHDGTPEARTAGAIYVGFALLGETLLLMGFVLLATFSGSLLISDAVAVLPASPWKDLTMALVIAGFGIKIGLLPVHFWMPVAYAATPIPAVAVLSGAGVKAGIIGLIRFLPLDVAMPDWGQLLTGLGMATAFFGVLVGITQSNPKAILAYSSVSQMGFMAAVFGMGLKTGAASAAMEGAFYAANHVLIKGALFIAVGLAALAGARHRRLLLTSAAVVALSLAGLPLTGGFLAKLSVKEVLGDGLVGMLAAFSAAGTTLLMLHFLFRLRELMTGDSAPFRLVDGWWVIAVAAVGVPWILYPVLGQEQPGDALVLSEIWKAGWPVLVGGLLAVGLRRCSLPRIPVGDIVATGRWVTPGADAFGRAVVRFDSFLRQWPVASIALLTAAILLMVVMLVGK